MRKVLIVTKNFPPISHSGTFRVASFTRHLPEYGVTPVVVCDATPQKTVEIYSRAQGQAPNDDVHCFTWETKPLCAWERELQRLPLFNSHLRQKSRHRYAASVLGEVERRFPKGAFDVVLTSSPPPEVHFIGQSIAQAYKVPFVCDLRDPWSYFFGERYRSAFDFLCERWLEKKLLSGATAVIANTVASANLLVTEIGVRADKVFVLPNGFDDEAHVDEAEFELLDVSTFNIVYAGLLATNDQDQKGWRRSVKKALGLEFNPLQVEVDTRSLGFILRVLTALFAERSDLRSRVVLHVFGQDPIKLEGEVERYRLNGNVRLHGPVSQKVANAACRRADLLLLLQYEMFHHGEPCPTCVPGKLFNYLSAGRPILAPMQDSESTDIIESLGAGKVVAPRDIDAIQAAIQNYFDDWVRFGPTPRLIPDLSPFNMRRSSERLAAILRNASIDAASSDASLTH